MNVSQVVAYRIDASGILTVVEPVFKIMIASLVTVVVRINVSIILSAITIKS
jgi:hypothetical protein